MLLNENKKAQTIKIEQLIHEQFNGQVAIPFTSEHPTTISFQTGIPRLLKTQSKLALDLVAIRKYFQSAQTIYQLMLDIRLRTFMIAAEYEDGLARALKTGAHLITFKLSDKHKDILIYGIKNRFPYSPLQLTKAEEQVVEEFKAIHSVRIVDWSEHNINRND
jgi:hypothetical protein